MVEPRSSTSGEHATPHHEESEVHDNHGSSTASWTLVGLVMLGTLVLCLAVVFWSLALTVVGILVIIAGLVAGRVLSSMGYGIAGRP
jgi:uncharacterized membrane protein